MKKLLIYFGLSSVLLSSCTKDFDEMNTDPTKSSPENFDANYFLSNSQWTYASATTGYGGALLFQSGWVQILASTSSGAPNYYSNGDKYAPSSNTNSYLASAWDNGYRAASFANEIKKQTAAKPELSNLSAIADIMKVLTLQYVTDVYGGIPYSQALKADAGITTPEYDNQQAIYTSLLADLEAAINALDVSKAKPISDIFPYNGDIAQWKKFGNSLMVRIAMRLSKVNAGVAQSYVEKAVASGTFAGNADNAFVIPDDANGYRNGNATALVVPGDYYQVRWSKKMIDYLKGVDDPRLAVIAEVPQAGATAAQNQALAGNSDPAVQLGLPNGFDMNGGATDISTSPGYPGATGTGGDASPIGRYSRPKMSVYTNFELPIMVLTYAETELLLAEAAVKGWAVGANASTHYANGVSAGLQTLAVLNSSAAITATVANAYATAHPLDVSSENNSLKQINEQYWATTGSYMNFVEAWNNWKRSGYPELTPVTYPGNVSGATIPRRQPYPLSEATTNGANYRAAGNAITGGDTWSSRNWWDN